MSKNVTLINDQITFGNVLVIGPNGEQLGNMSSDSARQIAEEYGLDLVLVSPDAKTPVCKILNFGKQRFEQQKREKENRKKSKAVVTKQIQLSRVIDKHDFDIKVKAARKFLEQKNRVNVVLRLRKREAVFLPQALGLANNFFTACEDLGKLAKPIAKQDNGIDFLILPLENK